MHRHLNERIPDRYAPNKARQALSFHPLWLIPGNAVWFLLEEHQGWYPGRILKVKNDHRQRVVIHYYDGMSFLQQKSVLMSHVLPLDDEQGYEVEQGYDLKVLQNLYLLKYFNVPEIAKRLTLLFMKQGPGQSSFLYFGPNNFLTVTPFPKRALLAPETDRVRSPQLPVLPWKKNFLVTVTNINPNPVVVIVNHSGSHQNISSQLFDQLLHVIILSVLLTKFK